MGQTVDVVDTNIKPGDVVPSSTAPFSGQEGRVVEIENNKVKLMINMFGTETQAELELYQIMLNCNIKKLSSFKVQLFSYLMFMSVSSCFDFFKIACGHDADGEGISYAKD